MLVLSRKAGEKLVIDGNITIHIVRIEGGKIRLGIEAPPAVSVRREELPSRIEPLTSAAGRTPTVPPARYTRATVAAR